MRVAINGFGRIGRSVFRILNFRENFDVVAINDIADNEAMTYLLKYDTVMGPFNDLVEIKGDVLNTSHNAVKMLAEKDPNQLPWGEMGVDVVIVEDESIISGQRQGRFISERQLTNLNLCSHCR